MLEFVEVSLGKGRLASCFRCHRAEELHYRQTFEVVDEIEAACAAWGEVAGPNVALTGPEPFGHPELPQLVAAAARAGVKRLRLDTDAIALAAPETAASVLAAGVRHLRVTLLGGTPGVHDALAGTPGALDRTLAGMRVFAEEAERAGIAVALSVRIPACHHNLQDLPNAVVVAAEARACHALLEIGDAGLDLPSAMPWIAAACDSGTINSLWVEVAGVPYCFSGGHALHLVPVLRTLPLPPGAKSDACAACALDEQCPGAVEGAAPGVVSALMPAGQEAELAEGIRRAYVAPTGPGEVE